MRLALVIVGLVACDRGDPPKPPPPPPAPRAPAPVADAPSVDAPPPAISVPRPVIPADIAGAPAWVQRLIETGAVRAENRLTTYTLQRHGSDAALTVDLQTSQSSLQGSKSILPLSAKTTVVYLGTVEEHGKTTTFTLANAGETKTLVCQTGKIAVAHADAVRARTPGASECGDRGRWVPSARTKVEALRCNLDEEPGPDRSEELAFVPAPGVEFLFVDDDCSIQGGGYRAIAKDAAIMDVR